MPITWKPSTVPSAVGWLVIAASLTPMLKRNLPSKPAWMPIGSCIISSAPISPPSKSQPSPWVYWNTPWPGHNSFAFNISTRNPSHLFDFPFYEPSADKPK
jgi:hypothetical protein